MIVKTPNKELAFHAVINTWLKDRTLYCNQCGEVYKEDKPACCDNPQVGRNFDHCYGLIKQNKEMAKSRLNDFGSNEDKNLRWGLSLPPSLFNVLDNFKTMNGQPKLFEEKGELTWFMKKFPQFKTCNRT